MALPVRSMSLAEAVNTTRTSSAWYFDENGVFQEESSSDVARIDYDPATGNRLGMMAEGASTNLLTYSEDLSNAAWTKSNVTIGTPTAFATNISLDEIVEDSTASATHEVSRSVTVTANTVLTLSGFFEANTRSFVRLIIDDGTGSAIASLNLGTGALDGSASTTGSGVAATATLIRNMGGGVYRFALAATPSNSATTVTVTVQMGSAAGTYSYNGNGSSSLYGGGLQLEQLSGASSYIPTTTAQVTRAAETHELVSLDPWYRASGYSVAVQYRLAFATGATSQGILTIDKGNQGAASQDERVTVVESGTGGSDAGLFAVEVGGFLAVSETYTKAAALTSRKVAARVSGGDYGVSAGGAAAQNDTSPGLPAPATTVGLGYGRLTTGTTVGIHMYGWIQDFKYTTTLWSDAELATESGTTV